jgi:hypothetical protein
VERKNNYESTIIGTTEKLPGGFWNTHGGFQILVAELESCLADLGKSRAEDLEARMACLQIRMADLKQGW